MPFLRSLLALLMLVAVPVSRAAEESAGKQAPGVLRVAAISALCQPGDTAANLKRHALWTRRAVAQGARFVGFPECSLTGYVFTPEAAIDLDGKEVEFILALAKKHDVYISAGLSERGAGGKFYNTQILAGPEGLLGVMRKINLTRSEAAFFTRGGDFPVFEVDGVKVAIAICADATHFETVRVLALRGAQMIFAPHASYMRGSPASWQQWRTSRWKIYARDCCAYLVGCNNAGRRDGDDDGETDLLFASGALIVGPDGNEVRRSQTDANTEVMIVSDLFCADIEKKRAGLYTFTELNMERFYGELVKDSPYLKSRRPR